MAIDRQMLLKRLYEMRDNYSAKGDLFEADAIEVVIADVEYGALDIKPPDIHWSYSGADEMYHVFVNGQKVHSAKTEYERDMFIAELKAKTGG